MAAQVERLQEMARRNEPVNPELLRRAQEQHTRQCSEAIEPKPAFSANASTTQERPPALRADKAIDAPATSTGERSASPGAQTDVLCSLHPDLPPCRSTPQSSSSFSDFEAREYMRCARAESGAGLPRDHCAKTVIEKARTAGLLSSGAINDCRTEASASPHAQGETMGIYECLGRRAKVEESRTSSILHATPPAPKAKLRQDGYRRPDMVEAMHGGDWPRLPQKNDTDVYFLNALGLLNGACPALNLTTVERQIIQANQRNFRDATGRLSRGSGSLGDLARVLAEAGSVFLAMEDCEQYLGEDLRYDSCLRKKDELFMLPDSVDARHDAGLLLRRHGCAGPEAKAFATNIGVWLTMPPERQQAVNWAGRNPQQAAQFDGLFQNCRRQAGQGAADAWCGCYVQQYSRTRPGSRAYPSDAYEGAKTSAFFGDQRSWFVPEDLSRCQTQRQELDLWRRTTPRVTTACLQSQSSLRAIAPDTKSCRYRTAWGEIEVRATQCLPTIESNVWGGEAVACR